MIENDLWKEDMVVVRRALQGDKLAYYELYNCSFYKARSLTRRLNFDNSLTEDDILYIANEAFERCILKLETYKAMSSFSTWMCGFVKFIVLETKRKRRRREDIYQKYLTKGILDFSCPSPEGYVLIREKYICVWRAYLALNEINRALISWHVLKRMSKKQLCSLTKLTSGEVDERTDRAVKLLKKNFFEIY